MKKDFKRKILASIIILPFFLYIVKSIFNLNLGSYNFFEYIYLIILNGLLGYILFYVWKSISTGKKSFNKLFKISVILVITSLICGWLKYENMNLQSTYNLFNYDDNRDYVNTTSIFSKDDHSVIDSFDLSFDEPKNIQNIVLTTRKTKEYQEIAANVYVCSKENCFYNFSLVNTDSTKHKTIIKIPKGYDITKVMINSDADDVWLDSIEYNNLDVINKMNKIGIFTFIIVLMILLMICSFTIYLNNKVSLKKYLKIINKIKIEKVFFVSSILLGIIFSFMIPVYNVPDEGHHIEMAYEEMGLDNISSQIFEKYKCDSCGNPMNFQTRELDINEYVRLSKIKLDDYSFSGFSPKITIIRHLPQVVGLIIGQAMHLPIFWILVLAELSAILFYAIVGYHIIKNLPFKKEIMFFIMLLPMAIQQYSSMSYDLILNISCLTLFALFFKYKYNKEKIDIKKILLILLLCLIIAICKLPYVLLILLFLLIPLKQYDIKIGKFKVNLDKIIKNKVTIIIGLIFIALVAIFILPKIEFGRLLISCMLEPLRTLVLLFNTIKGLTHFYISSCIANFGWLNTTVSKVYILFVCVFALFLAFFKPKDVKEKKVALWTKVLMAFIFLSIFIFLLIAMILWTYQINGIENMNTIADLRRGLYLIDGYIEGVQGRYFLSLLPLLLFLPDRFKFKINKEVYSFLQIIFYLISFGYSIYILLFKFWI